FWVLTPKTKQTAFLTIVVAARGYADCTRHLIQQSWAAFHEACTQAQSDCLLLTFSAKANVLSEEGTSPSHLCTAPESLKYVPRDGLGSVYTMCQAAAGGGSNRELGRAGQRGDALKSGGNARPGGPRDSLPGARADMGLRTSQGKTALNTACARSEGPGGGRQHQAVARRLLEAWADAWAAGCKRHMLLHNSCAHGCRGLAELLLLHGACAGLPGGVGHTPMDCALQAVQDAPNGEPEVLYTALLDYRAQPVCPEMLKHCANFPRALEVLLNAYPCIPSCDTWVEVVLPELWQEHEAFYILALCMVNQPRKLQHLAQLAVHAQLGSHCRQAAAHLPLPLLLRNYLLLHAEGRIQLSLS
ncbi:LOW QUALITY PROTEIN: hypothetical protein MC885_006239, partial [Smutsia gigantea]